MKLILDVSNQNPLRPGDFARSGAVALIAKATEGTDFKDKTLEAHRTAARAARVPFGSYTYIHWNDPGDQHKFYLDYARPKAGDLQPMVDAEDPKASVAELAKRSYACLMAFKADGYDPILYASADIWKRLIVVEPRLKRFRVWEADYPGRFTRWFPRLAKLRIRLFNGVTVVMWQWTDGLLVNGHAYDASALLTDIANLRIKAGL